MGPPAWEVQEGLDPTVTSTLSRISRSPAREPKLSSGEM